MCQKIVSVTYPNIKYGFTSPAGLWKVLDRVLIFVISPVAINKLIGFKAVTQFLTILDGLLAIDL